MVHGDTKCFSADSDSIRILALKIETHPVLRPPDNFVRPPGLGKVPLLQEPNGNLIYESLILSQYIDDRFDNGVSFLTNTAWLSSEEGQDDIKALIAGLLEVEAFLVNKLFPGAQIGFVDVMIWHWLSRFGNLQLNRSIHIPEEKYPKIIAWRERMYAISFIKSCTYPLDLLRRFSADYIKGHLNYDEGL
ncbi:hypothetical protein BV898_02906 [Hypsibius exemplaris]|uniref:GST C-terminal domain-containing protein n=1 Tax=Hypsibius exemplaris TaxID=2072580 RepID=A0A1W0X781_HYPEX|nr:hypothetical protein BV898_02906 [Hypsibius exemplaris]